MKIKFWLPILCALPMTVNAAIPYRVEQIKMPVPETPSGLDSEAYARQHRFYVGGMYDFSMWQNFTDDNDVSINGKNTSGFEAMVGLRIYDTFRIEGNYVRTDAKWNTMSLTGDVFMVNAIWDARIDNIYRIFRSQMIVPYVGIGAGLSWNSTDDGVKLDKKISPVAAAMAGISVEFSSIFALDFGYRYFYMFNPGTDVVADLNPTAQQFRVGARVSF